MLQAKKTETKTTAVSEATKDAGRVHIGGGAIHYADPTPAREATKDSGRVQMGGGAIHF
jgi:mannitol-1-phosphate/altronate dehydrogenase